LIDYLQFYIPLKVHYTHVLLYIKGNKTLYIFPIPEPELSWELLRKFWVGHINSCQEALNWKSSKHLTAEILEFRSRKQLQMLIYENKMQM
jgi:hypothetical protein